MSIIQFVEVFGIAIGAGAFGAALGVGGGVILVPALILITGATPQVAVAASVVSVIATSSAAAVAYVRDRYTDVRLALLLETTTSVGAIMGAFIARWVTGNTVAALFAVFLVYASWSILTPQPVRSAGSEADDAPGGLDGEYRDERDGQMVRYRVRRLRAGLFGGLISGNIAALLGVGGGLLMVPIMASRMGVPMRVAVATSNFMIGVTAVATAIPYYAAGLVNPYLAAPCALGVLVGARLGARFARRARVRTLRMVFAAVLLYTAFTMARRAHLLP